MEHEHAIYCDVCWEQRGAVCAEGFESEASYQCSSNDCPRVFCDACAKDMGGCDDCGADITTLWTWF